MLLINLRLARARRQAKIMANHWMLNRSLNSALAKKAKNIIKNITTNFLIVLVLLILFPGLALSHSKRAKQQTTKLASQRAIKTGAEQPALYLPLLKNKRVALFVNHTSLVGRKSLIDFLKEKNIKIIKLFAPEHGVRGNEDAGEIIKNSLDLKTNIPIVSLYSEKKKPSKEDLLDVDVLVFDIQDVGVSFYTYISSLQRLMEAALENKKPLIVLDRPNPNGFYVDGPVLPGKKKLFTHLQAIPIVYGMTMGEYAKMLQGEEWLDLEPKSKAKQLQLTIIPTLYYTHKSLYEPPVRPSPNLPNIQSIYLYPSIGFIEGRDISVGRGTNKPFQVFGHPKFKAPYSFIPRSMQGARNPPFVNQICHGWNLSGTKEQVLKKINGKFQIKYLIWVNHASLQAKLAKQQAKSIKHDESNKQGKSTKQSKSINGMQAEKNTDSKNIMAQMRRGMSEEEIRKTWEPELSQFKKIRKKYLLYPDF
jgi:uncharacterized protein YbbC (DUF1343 family)